MIALLAAAALDVAIDSVVAGVHLAADKPSNEGRVAIVEHSVPPPAPRNSLSRLGPEPFRILEGASIRSGVVVGDHCLAVVRRFEVRCVRRGLE
jgi:hypothetical protein